jgi:hypothetical protein
MPSKKQRRRREKLQRHEYEYVIETEEGEEEVVESPSRSAKEPARRGGQQVVVDKRGREIKPPSWGRVLKRGAIFGPILIVLIFVTSGNLSTAAKVLNALVLLLIFLPFSYLVDMLIYRSVAKRQRQNTGR